MPQSQSGWPDLRVCGLWEEGTHADMETLQRNAEDSCCTAAPWDIHFRVHYLIYFQTLLLLCVSMKPLKTREKSFLKSFTCTLATSLLFIHKNVKMSLNGLNPGWMDYKHICIIYKSKSWKTFYYAQIPNAWTQKHHLLHLFGLYIEAKEPQNYKQLEIYLKYNWSFITTNFSINNVSLVCQ